MENMTFAQLKDLDAVWTQMMVSANTVEKANKKNLKNHWISNIFKFFI